MIASLTLMTVISLGQLTSTYPGGLAGIAHDRQQESINNWAAYSGGYQGWLQQQNALMRQQNEVYLRAEYERYQQQQKSLAARKRGCGHPPKPSQMDSLSLQS